MKKTSYVKVIVKAEKINAIIFYNFILFTISNVLVTRSSNNESRIFLIKKTIWKNVKSQGRNPEKKSRLREWTKAAQSD